MAAAMAAARAAEDRAAEDRAAVEEHPPAHTLFQFPRALPENRPLRRMVQEEAPLKRYQQDRCFQGGQRVVALAVTFTETSEWDNKGLACQLLN